MSEVAPPEGRPRNKIAQVCCSEPIVPIFEMTRLKPAWQGIGAARWFEAPGCVLWLVAEENQPSEIACATMRPAPRMQIRPERAQRLMAPGGPPLRAQGWSQCRTECPVA
jgi:hypothetical protein